MTMAALLALGAPTLPEGDFYRVRSAPDGFVFVQIRRDVPPSWRTLWRSSRLVIEVRAYQNLDAEDDIRQACVRAVEAVAAWAKPDPYWSVVERLTGDHR